MKKNIALYILVILELALFCACAPAEDASVLPAGTESQQATAAPDETVPAGVPARPGSGKTGDPSAYLNDLVEKSGTVKTINDGLVLIDLADNGGEFMLRFSENSKWADGVDQKIEAGNTITCLVKPEPTLTTPSQGEVYEVTANSRS